MTTSPSLIGRIVAASTRHSLIVLFLAVLLTGLAAVFSARHFAMTTDTAELISSKLEWRQRDLAFAAAFPQFDNLTMVVVDGATPELADAATDRLFRALQETVEEGFVCFDLLLNDAVINCRFVLRKSLRALLFEGLAQRLLAFECLLVSSVQIR